MTRDELKKEFLEIKDVDTICNIFALIVVGSRGVFFSKKGHKKLANYVATFPTTSNELSDEEYKLKITTDVTLFGIDNIDLNYDVFVEAFRKYAYFNVDVEAVGNYVESQIFNVAHTVTNLCKLNCIVCV